MPAPTPKDLGKRVHPPKSLFREWPAIGTATLRSGETPAIPYHNYDSQALCILGSADEKFVTDHIQGPWRPVRSTDGRAAVIIYVINYKDTVVNPYKELIFAFVVTHKDKPALGPLPSPHAVLPLLEDKQCAAYLYKLWLDQQLAIDYGRELLGCDKYLDTEMKISFENDKKAEFTFHHVAGERGAPPVGPCFSGSIDLKGELHVSKLVSAYGLKRTMLMAAKGAAGSWHVVNPPGVMDIPRSASVNPVFVFAAEQDNTTFTTPSASDKLELGGEFKESAFVPLLYSYEPHLRAVLLAPFSLVPISE